MKNLTAMSLTQYSKIPDFIFYLLIAIYNFFNPMMSQFLFLICLIGIDTISGLFLMRHQKICFSLTKFSAIFKKIFGYTIICFAGFIIDEVFIKATFGASFMFNIFIMLLALNEFKSLVDNCSKILGIDVWRLVIKAWNKDKTL